MRYEAPAKVNLSLHVRPLRADGLHPLESLVQTIDWCDVLEVAEGDNEDVLNISGDISVDSKDNLVLRALGEIRTQGDVPPLSLKLEKVIPVGAGLGGGSSDAAACLVAAQDAGHLPPDAAAKVAPLVGADVTLFLTGGTLMMSGVGDQIVPVEALRELALAVVVPDFEMSTGDVYRRWDKMGGPVGPLARNSALPPRLRNGMPLRNDLLPAALNLEPRLGDFISDLRRLWGVPVFMTGSGSACFGYFSSVEEATEAASEFSVGRGAALRDTGVAAVEE